MAGAVAIDSGPRRLSLGRGESAVVFGGSDYRITADSEKVRFFGCRFPDGGNSVLAPVGKVQAPSWDTARSSMDVYRDRSSEYAKSRCQVIAQDHKTAACRHDRTKGFSQHQMRSIGNVEVPRSLG